ncbi:response regulator transcription factor [Sphaerobacter thermophilus]|uniref:response regulator transcription factor n=1 Tax=Sphaerobacter thermophilus TaxID=2057 RepID=UPI000DB1BB3E|nr:MAG: DNA-binding response regulator [Sphaerobacter thermophilus]
MRIVIVDADAMNAKFLTFVLAEAGHREIIHANSVPAALRAVFSAETDLVLLDLALPEMDGIALCQTLRERGYTGPIIFVTQGGTTQDKVRAFARGADDFVQRPFDPGELVARIGAVVRRAQHQARQQASTELRVGDATLSMSDLTFQVGDREPVRLTPTEMQILAHLMQSSGTPVSRKRLIERTWGVDFLHESNRVDVYIRRLREKIEPEPSSPIYVRTVRGVGYVFCPPEKSSSAPPNHEEPARTAAAGR